MARRKRCDSSSSSGTSTVSANVLARPNSGGCWRLRRATMLPMAPPFLKKAQYAYCWRPSPGISS